MLKIRKIKLENPVPVYDITVPESENFFANDVLVHNCSEIILPTNESRTAVCCLSSLNLEYYEDWKDDTLFLKDVAEMLDNVLTYFIKNAPDSINRARYSAERERSIGIGALGWHAYLQKNNIPWESSLAVSKNKKIFKHIREMLNVANSELGLERGEAPDIQSEVRVTLDSGDIIEYASSSFVNVVRNSVYHKVRAFRLEIGDEVEFSNTACKIVKVEKQVWSGKRFSHLMAIAPNASSSILMGNTSPSIEPYRANAYRQDTLSGSHLNKNKFLNELLQSKVSEEDELIDIWSSIIANDGSVQHLTILDDWERDVFKTSMEIDQRWVIQHAADRQEYIDQAQSLNVFFRPDSHIKYIHAVHFQAWKQHLKTMYYCRSDKIAKADKVSKKIEREVIKEIDLGALAQGNECLACEG